MALAFCNLLEKNTHKPCPPLCKLKSKKSGFKCNFVCKWWVFCWMIVICNISRGEESYLAWFGIIIVILLLMLFFVEMHHIAIKYKCKQIYIIQSQPFPKYFCLKCQNLPVSIKEKSVRILAILISNLIKELVNMAKINTAFKQNSD